MYNTYLYTQWPTPSLRAGLPGTSPALGCICTREDSRNGWDSCGTHLERPSLRAYEAASDSQSPWHSRAPGEAGSLLVDRTGCSCPRWESEVCCIVSLTGPGG